MTHEPKIRAPQRSKGPRADWQTQAACRNYGDHYLDPWDADPSVKTVNAEAAAFCSHCQVKRECLLAGLESDRMNGGIAFGIWGGYAPKQRRALVRLRYRLGCPVCKGKLVITPDGGEYQACASCGITWRCRTRSKFLTDGSELSS